MVNRFTTLFSPAPAQNPAAVPVRNTQSVYASMPVAGGAVRYSQPAATQRNSYQPASGGFSAPQPRRDVVQSLISLAGQRNAPLRNLGISPAAVAPLNRQVQAPTTGFNNIPVVGNLMARSAAAQVAETLMSAAQRTQAQQQQSQLFDQQIQFTKTQADPVAWMDPAYPAMMDKRAQQIEQMRVGFENATPLRGAPPQPGYNVLSSANAGSQRSSKQQQASLAFPQMSDAEIDRLSPQQLDALLAIKPVNADQYRYEPIVKTQGSTQAGKSGGTGDVGPRTEKEWDHLAQLEARANTLQAELRLGVQDPSNMAERVAYDQAAKELKALHDQIEIRRTGKRDTGFDPWGVTGAISTGVDTAGNILSYDIGKPVGDAIKEYGGPAVEAFFQTPEGQLVISGLELLNGPYEWNTKRSGGEFYRAATNTHIDGYADNIGGDLFGAIDPNGYLTMSPDAAVALALYAAKPELRQGVIDAYEQGYSSPTYTAIMEAAGEPYEPQFTGEKAVHEYLIGQTDDWPPVLRDAFRLGEGVVMDPLTYAPLIGTGGKALKEIGKVIALADDSSALTKVAGRGIQATGGAVEIGAKLPDMVFEGPISGYNWWTRRGGRAPGTPGFAQLSTDQQIMDAHTQAAQAAGLIARNTDEGGAMVSADEAALNMSLSKPEVKPTSTVEAEADIADGIAPAGPRVVRPEAPTSAAPTSTVPRGATPLSPTAYAQPVGPGQIAVTNTAIPEGQPNRTIRIETKPSGTVIIHTSTGPQVAGSFDEAIAETERIQGWVANDSVDIPEAAVANEAPDTPVAGAAPSSTVPEPPGRTVEEYQVQRIADPPTSAAATDSVTRPAAPLRTADEIPVEAPAVRTAVERYNTTVDTTGRVGTTYFTPVYGGSRLPDAPITRAVVSGDLDAIARANELAEVFEPLALPLLQDDPVTGTWFRSWSDGGRTIDGNVAIPNRSLAQDAALETMVSRDGRRLAAPYRAAQMTKELLEHAAELKVLAEAYAPLYREIMGEAPVNRPGDQLFGYTWTPVGPDGLPIPGIQRAQYLMERFVFTSSDEYADYIRALWNDPNYQGAGVLNITDGPKPYLQGIPDSVRADVLRVLEDARAAYKAAARSSDEDFASGAWRKGLHPTGKPTSAVQLGGGLKGSSKQAEKLAEKWIEASEPKRKSRNVLETRASGDDDLLPVVTVDGFAGEIDSPIIRVSERFKNLSSEQSPQRALAFVDPAVPMRNYDELYFSTLPRADGGLGTNKGVNLVFDPAKIRGQVTVEIPGVPMYPETSAYIIGREANPQVYRDALQTVTIGKRSRAQAGDLIAALDAQGWRAAELPNGRLEYKRPPSVKGTPAEAWANSPTRTARKPKSALGFAEFDPLADALLNEKGELRAKGSLGRKFDQAQRAADDTAVANVKNPVLRFLNETAAPGFDRKTTEYLNTDLPGWHPPGTKPGQAGLWEPSEWTVFDALQWGYAHKKGNPEFDYEAFVNDIGERAAGIPPKMTPAEQKVAVRLAKANGEPTPKFRDVENQRSLAHKTVRGYDKYLTQIRQSSLFGPISGPAGFVGDVIGNTWAAIVNGHFGAALDVANPLQTRRAWKTYRTTRTPVEYVNPMEMQSAADGYAIFSRNAHQAADAMMTDVLRETGQLLPLDMYPAGTLREVPVSGKPSLNAAVEGRNAVVRFLANLWTIPGIKDGRTATDLVGRTSLTKRVYRNSIKRDAIPAFRKLVAQHAGQANVDQVMRDILAAAEQRAKDAGVAWKGNFSPADVKKATEGQSYSNPLARGWQSELNRSLDLAMAEQKRVYFSYKNTKADEVVGSVFMFHYWQTRASYMHLRAALRNPVLLNGYYKIFEELKQRNEQGGMGYLGPIYKFMTSPSGIYAAVDPLGLLIPTTLIDMQDQEGSKFRVLQNQLNPMIGAALAVAGITDNVPNVTGLRTTERWLINLGNFLVAEGVDLASVPLLGKIWNANTMQLSLPIDEAVKTILQEMNQWWAGKGIPVGEFAPFDRGANEKDQLNTWVLKGVEAQYGPMDPYAQTGPWAAGGEAWQAMDDAIDALTTGVPNPIADEAERQYAMEGLIQAALAPVVPGGVITRSGYRDEQIAGNAADDPAASLNRDLAKSGSTTWDIMQQQYNQIGTPDEQRIYQDYIALTMNPENIGTVVSRTPSGQLTVLRQSQISAMSDEEREDFINRWIAANPGYEAAILKVQSGRDAFKAANPQFGEFKEYQKFMYDEEGKGVRALRTTLEKENPNFGRKIKEYRDYLKSQGVTGAELERRLDSWAAGVDGYRAFMGIPLTNDDKPIAVYDPSQNPYASSAFAGFGADGGGSDGDSGGGSKLTEGPDGKLYNEDGQMVNEQGKPINDKGQVIDDYWYPEKVSERLAQGVAKYDKANQQMEDSFGDLWNQQTGEWEDWADSASERRRLGYGDVAYAYPEKSDLMREFEAWRDWNGGGTLDDWLTYLMNEPGYGVAADPATTLNYGPKDAPAATATAPASGNRFTQLGDKLAQPSPPSGLPGVSWLPSVGSKPEENDDAQQMLSVARSYVGQVPYVWGGIPGKGQDPSGGWDCSGMVYWLDQNYGSGDIPMGSHYQYQYAIDTGKLFTDMKKLQPGDVVFIDTGWYGGAGGDINPAGHVGIYAGNGQLINATNATQGTVIQPISDYGNILGAMHGSW